MAEFKFKKYEKEDSKVLMDLITQMAVYEKLEDQLIATEDLLNHWILEEKKLEMFLLQEDEAYIGYVCFFNNFSTFLCKPGLYLEDLFILPEYRGKGYGKESLRKLAKIAVERGYGRFEWICLKWNQSAIDVYKNMGAKEMSEWTMFRVDGETLQEMGKQILVR